MVNQIGHGPDPTAPHAGDADTVVYVPTYVGGHDATGAGQIPDKHGNAGTPWGRWYFDEDSLDQVAVWRILTINTDASGHADPDFRYTPDMDPIRRNPTGLHPDGTPARPRNGRVPPYQLEHKTIGAGAN